MIGMLPRILFSFIFIIGFALSAQVAYGAPEVVVKDSAYAATYVSQSEKDPIAIGVGQTKQVKIQFKNVGSAKWSTVGPRYVSAYTMEPRYRSSRFQGRGWRSAKQTGSFDNVVVPGEVGTLTLTLTAPKVPGEYTEKFYLAAENYTWLEGGYFFLKFNVTEAKVVEDVPVVEVEEPTPTQSGAQATLVGISGRSVSAVGGEEVKLIMIYRNSGESAWNDHQIRDGSSSGNFYHGSWEDSSIIDIENSSVPPGGVARHLFHFRAPKTKGTYTFVPKLYVGGELVDGKTSVRVTVTKDGRSPDAPPVVAPDTVETTKEGKVYIPDTMRFSQEPRIRVGIQSKDDEQEDALHFISYEDDYTVFNGEKEVGVLRAKRIAVMTYRVGVYSYKGDGISFRTNSFIRLEPVNDERAIFELMNINRPMAWSSAEKHNRYRGAVEYRQGKNDGEMYIVNDLLLEDYTKGVRETGKGYALEMVKANLTAARTYAYMSLGKYPFFDVLATTYDQLYLGVDSEEADAKIAQASDESRGTMVTYDGKVVITPYFGNTDGRTRAWSDVWGGGHKPWLVSVPATYDKRDGKRMFGHGVGMSQRDAAIRADEEELNFVELLQYYYTNTVVEHVYQ